MNTITRQDCIELDHQDRLAGVRDEFVLEPGLIYLDGNSLGPLTHKARDRLAAAVEQEWGQGVVRSWNACDWIGLPRRLGQRIARLVGARPDEVLVGDSTSVNLFKLAAAVVGRGTARRKIVTELGNFPTDLYVLQGLAGLLSPALELTALPRDQVLAAIDDQTALVVLTHVHYKSSEMFDLRDVTARAHERGALTLWDLSHSVGAVPLALNECEADLAVGCTYKYLNGGPGAPAFLYVRRQLQSTLRPVLAGWMGHAQPFRFLDDYAPADGVERHGCGTHGVLGMAALEGSLSVFDRIDMADVREKSVRMTDLFISLVEQECDGCGLQLASPRNHEQRGSHVAFAHAQGHAVMRALIRRKVVGDFRAPDLLRFGMTPLYLRYADLWDAVAFLKDILKTQAWREIHDEAVGVVT